MTAQEQHELVVGFEALMLEYRKLARQHRRLQTRRDWVSVATLFGGVLVGILLGGWCA